ncbi:CBS domain-containing protein [Bacillus sp. Xin]|uniref:cyclic di-AMP binding protein CbpA n=1 Tax=unclassified Bacillus (in: firmicutes) TaxID=185979 RepID=UPI0015730016|nr:MULTISPECIES: cyclic di-AMP binding protein CbpA [unclassified Bacillus (in: firmicutes)]MBC6972332.1 CBS domain-containing protein [Bacillus sp. Xin]NSW38229.1 CBS domain-containing protein [Bacillus sp. Xin1]
MRIKGNYVPKKEVLFCSNSFTVGEALDHLNKTGYRCVPVLDAKQEKFLGNVYKVDILEYKGSLEDDLSELLNDKEGYVREDSSFFKVFFTIKKLPYLSVVDEKGIFLGILTHKKVFELLEDAWGVHSSVYSVMVGTQDYNGAIQKLSTVLKKYSGIQSLMTFDNNALLVRRIMFTLGEEFKAEELEILLKDLEDHGFRVVYVEEMNNPREVETIE